MKKETLIQQSSLKINKGAALFNLALVIVTLGLVVSLSVNSNFLFFKELLMSSVIIFFVAMMKFLNLKSQNN